jgi:DNA primase
MVQRGNTPERRSVAETPQRVGDFYAEVVLPALAAHLDAAFPEFGWRRDAHGWVASNQEMTHRVLGVRADRVVAHGDSPPGFLVHGGQTVLWTAYVNGGKVPRGDAFRSVVRDLAGRAGVDAAPIERPHPRDRRGELLADFFRHCRGELHRPAGAPGRTYLEGRGFPPEAIGQVDLGVVPPELFTKNALEAAGYTDLEIARSGVLADGRWPGRLCGAWRDEHGRIGTFWTRALRDSDTSTRYLYLRGASRSALPPYGISEVLRLPVRDRREVVLVEGLIDVHHLRAHGYLAVAAAGGARVRASSLTPLGRHGVESLVLAFDNDLAGRDGVARAIEDVSRASRAPALRILDPNLLGDAKDPDGFVQQHGIARFRELVDQATCAVTWRALELIGDTSPHDPLARRRQALARAGSWLGSLPPRLSLEQEDAIHQVAERCGYSREAVERSFRARFWGAPARRRGLAIER